MFEKAVKLEAKLRLAITGTSGSGKTYTALNIAKYLTDKRIALVDTEHGSASKYADLFDFDVLDMSPPFHPERFSKLIREAQDAGYGVIILDSLSHAWNGTGGLLEIVDDIATKSPSKNTFAAWKHGTPIYNKLIDSIIQSDIHVIATMRSKQDYVMVEKQSASGKSYQAPEKVGMAPIQRDGFEYEFDIVLNMDSENTAVVSKTRCSALQSGMYRKPGVDIAKIMRDWLGGVKSAPATPKPQSAQAAQAQTVAETRPYSAATLKAKFDARRKENASANVTDVERKICAAALMKIFPDDTPRYETCKWLTGIASTKDMTPASVKTLLEMMSVKSFDTPPSEISVKELRAAHAAELLAAGQMTMTEGKE